MPDDLPGPHGVPERARQGRVYHRRGPAQLPPLQGPARPARKGHGGPARGRTAAGVRLPLPARVLGRPAAAHRHRPGPDHGAGVHCGGRAHLGAGCFHPRPGAQPAEQPQGFPRADLPLHRTRPVGRPVHLGPHRRHQQGPYRGAGRDGRALPPSPAPLHQSPAVGRAHPRSRPGEEKAAAGLRPVHP